MQQILLKNLIVPTSLYCSPLYPLSIEDMEGKFFCFLPEPCPVYISQGDEYWSTGKVFQADRDGHSIGKLSCAFLVVRRDVQLDYVSTLVFE